MARPTNPPMPEWPAISRICLGDHVADVEAAEDAYLGANTLRHMHRQRDAMEALFRAYEADLTAMRRVRFDNAYSTALLTAMQGLVDLESTTFGAEIAIQEEAAAWLEDADSVDALTAYRNADARYDERGIAA